MDHILVRVKGTSVSDIQSALKSDAADHAKHGLLLRHIWKNADDPDEVLFIFTAADLDGARKYIEAAHSLMQKENPDASLTQVLFLKGV
jgi:hypothetical protein